MSTDNIHTAAVELGRKGGQSTSAAKVAASRANGKLGGRPRKKKAPKLPARSVLFLGGANQGEK
jgi:hypothetical protein